MFVALDLFRGEERGHELASIVAASGLVYLGAAALNQPRVAWLVFLGSVVVITAAKNRADRRGCDMAAARRRGAVLRLWRVARRDAPGEWPAAPDDCDGGIGDSCRP